MIKTKKVFTSYNKLYASVKYKHGEHHLYLGMVPDTVLVRWEDGMFIERYEDHVVLYDKKCRKVIQINLLSEE